MSSWVYTNCGIGVNLVHTVCKGSSIVNHLLQYSQKQVVYPPCASLKHPVIKIVAV